jgi:hypothetical protein
MHRFQVAGQCLAQLALPFAQDPAGFPPLIPNRSLATPLSLMLPSSSQPSTWLPTVPRKNSTEAPLPQEAKLRTQARRIGFTLVPDSQAV